MKSAAVTLPVDRNARTHTRHVRNVSITKSNSIIEILPGDDEVRCETVVEKK